MEAIDGDELFREIERRAEMVHPSIDMLVVPQAPDVFLVAKQEREKARFLINPVAKAENTGASGQRSIAAVRFFRIIGISQPAHDFFQRV